MKVALVNLFEFDEINRRLGKMRATEIRASPPMGLLSLAASLRPAGHTVTLVDWVAPVVSGALPLDDGVTSAAAEYLGALDVDVLGFTSRCDSYHYTLELMQLYRGLHPRTPLVLGGPQATITAGATMDAFPFVDFIVRNEGEESFLRLLEVLSGRGSLSDVPGLSYRCGSQVRATEDSKPIANLDDLPMPAYDLYPPADGQADVEVGRGCPYSCTFCSTSVFFKRRFRLKSAVRIVQEIKTLQQTYAVKEVCLIHDMLTANRRRVLELCDLLSSECPGLLWRCSARADCVDHTLLRRMRSAGCDGIFFGIEAGSERMQRRLHKNLDLTVVAPVIKACAELGIKITASFITGFPDETLNDVEQTLRKSLECSCLGADAVQLHKFSPLPGTPIVRGNEHRLRFTGFISDTAAVKAPRSDRYERMMTENPVIFSGYHEIAGSELTERLRRIDSFGYAIHHLRYTCSALIAERAFTGLTDLYEQLIADAGTPKGQFQSSTDVIDWMVDRLIAHLCRFFAAEGSRYPVSLESFKHDVCAIRVWRVRDDVVETGRKCVELGLDSVPSLVTDCALATFLCDPGQLIACMMRLQPGAVRLSGQGQRAAVVRFKNARKRGSTRHIRLNSWMSAVLTGCNGRLSVGGLAAQIFEARPFDGSRSLAECLSTTARIVRRFVAEGLLDVADDRGQGSSGTKACGGLYDIDAEIAGGGIVAAA